MLIICSIVSIGLSFYHPSDEGALGMASMGEEYALVVNASSGSTASSDNLEWVEGAAILIAVIVVVFVTAFNDWRKEKQFRGLKDRIEADNHASVVRGGVVKQVTHQNLIRTDLELSI
jgi:Ca2+ transporting ATPase